MRERKPLLSIRVPVKAQPPEQVEADRLKALYDQKRREREEA